jgi:hypothetical protein
VSRGLARVAIHELFDVNPDEAFTVSMPVMECFPDVDEPRRKVFGQ